VGEARWKDRKDGTYTEKRKGTTLKVEKEG
jgi:hypothetical protein